MGICFSIDELDIPSDRQENNSWQLRLSLPGAPSKFGGASSSTAGNKGTNMGMKITISKRGLDLGSMTPNDFDSTIPRKNGEFEVARNCIEARTEAFGCFWLEIYRMDL